LFARCHAHRRRFHLTLFNELSRKHPKMSMAISSNTPSVTPVAQVAARPVSTPKINDGDADDGAAKPAAGNVQSLPLATSGAKGTLVNIAVK